MKNVLLFIKIIFNKSHQKELELKKRKLRKAYKSANKDEGQLEAKEWEGTNPTCPLTWSTS
jgi:hypothetical protein